MPPTVINAAQCDYNSVSYQGNSVLCCRDATVIKTLSSLSEVPWLGWVAAQAV